MEAQVRGFKATLRMCSISVFLSYSRDNGETGDWVAKCKTCISVFEYFCIILLIWCSRAIHWLQSRRETGAGWICISVFLYFWICISVYCLWCSRAIQRRDRGWLDLRDHTQLCSPAVPAETTETGIMNQTRNKKPETIMNQRIISAERAFFSLCRVEADHQLLTQSIKIFLRHSQSHLDNPSLLASHTELTSGEEGCLKQVDGI